MTFKRSRVLRTVGIACAASMMLVALPIGMAHAAGPRMPSALPTTGDPKLEAALKAAPELEGATFDVSGVTFAPGEITVANPKFTSTGPAIMSDNTMQNPLNPADPDQPTYSLTTTSQSYTRTDTTTYTRTHEFGTSLALGYTFQWGINLGAFSGQHQYSATMTLSYKYSDSVATTATDTKTITSTPQTVPVRPGHSVRVVQFVDIGKYEADLTVNGTLQGNVVVKKCGNAVSLPIGQLAALPRDAGQGPLVPSSTPDGDVLRQTATVRWVADLATQAYTRVTDTVMATKSVTETTTPSGTTPTGTSPSRNTPMVVVVRSIRLPDFTQRRLLRPPGGPTVHALGHRSNREGGRRAVDVVVTCHLLGQRSIRRRALERVLLLRGLLKARGPFPVCRHLRPRR